MVSHDSGLLNDCCSHILQITNLKLNCYKGNLDDFVKAHPEARAYFSFTESKLKFRFPQPGTIEGVKSKGKVSERRERVLMKARNIYEPPLN
tara:strand:+ start:88 stop:363 length:276 start_codon:yes stop_codon:yes gene_type:complete